MDGLVSIFPYRAGIQNAIKRLKYRFVREMGEDFVKLSSLRVDAAPVELFKKGGFIAVPIPLHKTRERWRGFNQAALLGRILADKWDLDYKSLLTRVRKTDVLAELKVNISRSEKQKIKDKYISITQRRLAERKLTKKKKAKLRKIQMKGAFQIASGKREARSRKFLLIDDVWTSGATMLECAKVLKRSGADSVWGFTFARSGW
jgi:predicted amidophosphoribosyltransferase